MLFVSHNVAETQSFQRVLVFEHGRIVEDGAPAELLMRANSTYGALLMKERAVEARLADPEIWRRRRLEDGAVSVL